LAYAITQSYSLRLTSSQFLGQVVNNIFPNATKTVFGKWKMNKLGSASLLVIIWSTYDQAFSSGAFADVKTNNVVFLVFISIALFFFLLGICFGLAMLWLPRDDVIAVCYCVPAKTPAMGVPLAHVMFIGLSTQLESKIQIPLVIYQGLQIVAGSLLTILFRNWMKPHEEAAARAANALKS
jgi:sodium/bile acid cotransporter 7